MNPHAVRAAEIESAFLAGAETNLNQARGFRLRGSRWTWTTRTQEEKLRQLMAARGAYDRDLLRNLPRGRARVLTGKQPRFLLGERRTSVAVASVLTPPEQYFLQEGEPPPVTAAQLLAHVRELAGEPDVPYLIGVCSPSGFTEEARRGQLDVPNVTIVLVEQRPDGGWSAVPGSRDATQADCRLFDPEGVSRKLDRIRQEVRGRSADLLTGGLSAARLAEQTGIPVRIVTSAFEQIASADGELKLTRQRGDVLLWRGAPAAVEDGDMSMVEWVRQLFSREGNEARKINALSERRVKLVQRRERLYTDISQLEEREASLLRQGRESASTAVKRRVASQIKQVRDDMERLNASARMIGQQVEVISTHIHNLSLIQQGKAAKLPATEEITQDAVRAEEMLEQLASDVELVGSLSTGSAQTAASDEELAILRELEAPAAPQAGPGATAARTPLPPEGESKSRRQSEPEAG